MTARSKQLTTNSNSSGGGLLQSGGLKVLKAPGKALLGHCGGGSQNSSSSSLLDRGPGKPERSSVGVVNEVILGNNAETFRS